MHLPHRALTDRMQQQLSLPKHRHWLVAAKADKIANAQRITASNDPSLVFRVVAQDQCVGMFFLATQGPQVPLEVVVPRGPAEIGFNDLAGFSMFVQKAP
jgi:hypothetical protein